MPTCNNWLLRILKRSKMTILVLKYVLRRCRCAHLHICKFPINHPNIILKVSWLTGPFYEKSSYQLCFFLFIFSYTLLVNMSESMSKSRHRYSLRLYEHASTTFVSAFPMAIHNFVVPKLVAWTLVQQSATKSSPKGLALVAAVFSRDSHALAWTLQQPWGARAWISVTAHAHFLRYFTFLSWLLPLVSLQLEAATCCAERSSLASCNRAVLVPIVGTALSGRHFFCLLVLLTHELSTYWSYWVWLSRASHHLTSCFNSHLSLRQLWRVILAVVSLCLSVAHVVENFCVVAPKWSIYCQFLLWNGHGSVCSLSVFSWYHTCMYACMYVHVYAHACVHILHELPVIFWLLWMYNYSVPQMQWPGDCWVCLNFFLALYTHI